MIRTGVTFKTFQFKNGKYLKGLKRRSLIDPNNHLKPGELQVAITNDLRMAMNLTEGEDSFLAYLDLLNGEVIEFEYVIENQGGTSDD